MTPQEHKTVTALYKISRLPKEPTPPPPEPEKTELDLMLEKHAADDVKENVDNGAGSAAPDPTDLAMLGIDPDDLAGFGN